MERKRLESLDPDDDLHSFGKRDVLGDDFGRSVRGYHLDARLGGSIATVLRDLKRISSKTRAKVGGALASAAILVNLFHLYGDAETLLQLVNRFSGIGPDIGRFFLSTPGQFGVFITGVALILWAAKSPAAIPPVTSMALPVGRRGALNFEAEIDELPRRYYESLVAVERELARIMDGYNRRTLRLANRVDKTLSDAKRRVEEAGKLALWVSKRSPSLRARVDDCARVGAELRRFLAEFVAFTVSDLGDDPADILEIIKGRAAEVLLHVQDARGYVRDARDRLTALRTIVDSHDATLQILQPILTDLDQYLVDTTGGLQSEIYTIDELMPSGPDKSEPPTPEA